MENILIVTPAHNEAENLPILAAQLASSTRRPDLWIIVDDGSVDSTLSVARSLNVPFDMSVIGRGNMGRLIGGSAFTAWQHGIDVELGEAVDKYDFIMKLDADVELPETYLERAIAAASQDCGVVGGVVGGVAAREQAFHVPGPVKLYTRSGYKCLDQLPRVVGFDVMDEVAIVSNRLRVVIVDDLVFGLRRAIGSSQGKLHGRYRNGRVCAWTGYHRTYFLLHLLRYAFRRPIIIGSIWLLAGYVTAPASPYSAELRVAHKQAQSNKLRKLCRSPYGFITAAYRLRKPKPE